MNEFMDVIKSMNNLKIMSGKIGKMATALNKSFLRKVESKNVQHEAYLQQMKNFHGSCLPKRNQNFCYSYFGHPHISKLCGRASMMQEVLDAENVVSQATDVAVNMNIGNEESIEDENNSNTSNH
jgi:hypothetical protein